MVSNRSNVEQCLMRLIDLKNITNGEAELNFLVMLWGPAQLFSWLMQEHIFPENFEWLFLALLGFLKTEQEKIAYFLFPLIWAHGSRFSYRKGENISIYIYIFISVI